MTRDTDEIATRARSATSWIPVRLLAPTRRLLLCIDSVAFNEIVRQFPSKPRAVWKPYLTLL